MDKFTAGYIECALWADTPDDAPADAELSPETRARMVAACAEFQAAQRDVLDALYARGIRPEQAGHDFWLTRNGHGAGFWDRGLGELGDRLTEACRPYGTSYLYVGDDGLVYVS